MRKFIVGVLVVFLVVVVVGLVGLWWGRQSIYPFVFDVPRFKLSENWYLGESVPRIWSRFFIVSDAYCAF